MKNMKKAFVALMMMTFAFVIFVIPARAAEHPDRVVDRANVINDGKEAELRDRLDKASEKFQLDVCIVTVEEFDENTVTEAADNYYDRNGYGMGNTRSGIMLYICPESRDFGITTRGEGIKVYKDSKLESLKNRITPKLSGQNYEDACGIFADLSLEYLDTAKVFPWIRFLIISVIIALIVGGIRHLSLKSQLKSVSAKNQAGDYVVKSKLNIQDAGEMFLYRELETKKKPETQGTTHTSSSGATHGGTSGKF